MSEQIISKDAYEKLEKEFEYLSKIKRREIADRIQSAKEMGDLSENAEYSEAKDAQAFNEGKIGELKALLKNLTIVDNGSNGNLVVTLGSTIKVSTQNKEKVFTIVSFNEVDPLVGKISNESPMGMAFIGKKKGEEVLVSTPKGDISYKVVNIQ